MNKGMKQKLMLISTSVFLTSCAFYLPEYKHPSVDTPTETKNGIKIESNVLDFSQQKWWIKFNDKLLDNLISQALKNNNQLKIAQGNIMMAQAQLKAAQYAWIPTLNLSGSGLTGNSYMTNITPQSSLSQLLPSGSRGNTNFNVWEGGFVPNYSVNIFANINQEHLAKASLELQKANLNATKLSIISQVAGGYFMLLGQRKQLQLERQVIRSLDELCRLQQYKITVGKGDVVTLRLLQQQLDNTKAVIPQIEYSISTTENALKILLGENPGLIGTTRDINSYDVNGIIPVNIPSSVLKNRPDILMAENNLKMANANVGLANSVFFPTISLTGNIGGVSMALSNLFSLGTGFWFVQAAANMPILNASSYEQIKVAKGGYYVAYYNYVQTVKSAFADVDDSLTNQQKINETYLAYNKSYLAILDYYNLILIKYQVGTQDKYSLLNAKLQVTSSELTLNLTKMQQLSSLVEVYQSLAGGYAN